MFLHRWVYQQRTFYYTGICLIICWGPVDTRFKFKNCVTLPYIYKKVLSCLRESAACWIRTWQSWRAQTIVLIRVCFRTIRIYGFKTYSPLWDQNFSFKAETITVRTVLLKTQNITTIRNSGLFQSLQC